MASWVIIAFSAVAALRRKDTRGVWMGGSSDVADDPWSWLVDSGNMTATMHPRIGDMASGGDSRVHWPSEVPQPKLKVFVYLHHDVNWLPMITEGRCGSRLANRFRDRLGFKHSADQHFARAVTSDAFLASEWSTRDPLEADILAIPLLVGFFQSNKEFGRSYARRCGGRSWRQWQSAMARRIRSSPHYEKTKNKHFFIADNWSIRRRPDLFEPSLREILSLAIGATFEGRPASFARCTVPPPYVPARCVRHNGLGVTSLDDAWFGLRGGDRNVGMGSPRREATSSLVDADKRYVARPIDVAFHGAISRSHRRNYAFRLRTCNAMARFARRRRSGGGLVCCSSAGPRDNMYHHECGEGPSRVACRCAMSILEYCDEMLSARLALFLGGDTPISTRIYDAVRHGTVALRFDGNESFTDYVSASVPWRDMVLFSEPTKRPSSLAFDDALAVPSDALRKARERMRMYSSVLDWWAADGLPASKFLLADAYKRCAPGH